MSDISIKKIKKRLQKQLKLTLSFWRRIEVSSEDARCIGVSQYDDFIVGYIDLQCCSRSNLIKDRELERVETVK